ncbi:MAG: MATE family efflux transporter [Bacteroidetes bacterium]|nr:MAG: MATE family efflux transporter [Bacteroidota bacterium]
MQVRDYTYGPIGRQIIDLALPIMGIAFIQMAYTLADLFWIGHLGSIPTAAVGAGGIFLWIAQSLCLTTKVGAEITISQSLGAKRYQRAYRFARHALALSILFGLAYGITIFLARRPLIGFYGFQDALTHELAVTYLGIIATGMVFTFVNFTYFGMYTGNGQSRMAFIANSIGLTINLLLDPLMINGYLGFPQLGVAGAAYATVFSQGIVTLIFWGVNLRSDAPFHRIFHGFRPSRLLAWRIVAIGTPVAAQSALFAIVALVLARFIAQWGDLGVAVQSLGSELEALSWMTASGFASALGSFVGQNWGAKNYQRVRQGYRITLVYSLSLGLIATILFVFFGGQIFGLFIPEPKAMMEGQRYLRIMGYTQVFMVLEITTSGVFNGIGRTSIPAYTGIAFNLLRIPLALWWGAYSLVGIWWAICLSMVLKGVVLCIWLILAMRRFPDRQPQA